MMKNRIRTHLCLLTVWSGVTVIPSCLLSACSGEDSLGEPPSIAHFRQWAATGIATAGNQDETTRALSVGGSAGKTLYFTWDGIEGGDVIKVYDSSDKEIGAMSVEPDASNKALAKLTGTVEGDFSVGDPLSYYYPNTALDFTGQKGTIADLSKNRQFMKSDVTVEEVDDNRNAILMSGATFSLQESVLRFRFQAYGSGNRLHVEELTISASSGKLVQRRSADGTIVYGDITITPDAEDGEYPGELYVALHNDNEGEDTYTFTARVGEVGYASVLDKSKVTASLSDDRFYSVARRLTLDTDAQVEGSTDVIIEWEGGVSVINGALNSETDVDGGSTVPSNWDNGSSESNGATNSQTDVDSSATNETNDFGNGGNSNGQAGGNATNDMNGGSSAPSNWGTGGSEGNGATNSQTDVDGSATNETNDFGNGGNSDGQAGGNATNDMNGGSSAPSNWGNGGSEGNGATNSQTDVDGNANGSITGWGSGGSSTGQAGG